MTYRDEARASRTGKVARVLGGANQSSADAVMASEGARGTQPVKKAVDNAKMAGKPAKGRLDRPARASGGSVKKGKTNVTVIVAPQGGAGASGVGVSGGPPPMMPAAPPPPMGAPAGPPPGVMPPRPPMGAPPMGAPPQGMPMRKRGGVVMKAGGGSGMGRLEKAGMS